MLEVRCTSKKHGELISEGILEVKCDSRICRRTPDEIVIHQFSVTSGELLETKRYREILKGK